MNTIYIVISKIQNIWDKSIVRLLKKPDHRNI